MLAIIACPFFFGLLNFPEIQSFHIIYIGLFLLLLLLLKSSLNFSIIRSCSRRNSFELLHVRCRIIVILSERITIISLLELLQSDSCIVIVLVLVALIKVNSSSSYTSLWCTQWEF